jgi:uncharacterized protein YegP (UPF0339 family)
MHFEILRASGGQFYWRLLAANGELIATSESFYSQAQARASAESVKQGVPQATIVERAV